MRSRPRFLLVLLFFLAFTPAHLCAQAADRQALKEALGWVREAPRDTVEYDYEMSARVRLILFWAGKENVGGGYVRKGHSSGEQNAELVQVLFGSDPAKAPRAINRWGAGTEVFRQRANSGDGSSSYSAFFGFMKSTKGKSVSEMQGELAKESTHGEHLFSAILSRVESGRALSLLVRMQSDVDYNLHQLSEAQSYVFDEFLSSPQPVKEIPSAQQCSRNSAFLGTVAELIDAALAGQKTPVSLCYVYDAQVHNLTLRSATPLSKLTVRTHAQDPTKPSVAVDQTYSDLLETEFLSESKQSGKHSSFTLILGTSGKLRGIPIQIRYQPNWWFQVVLNLRPESSQAQWN
jgi:hypothetical protein